MSMCVTLGLPLRAPGLTLEAFGAHFGDFWVYFRGPAPVTLKSDREWGPLQDKLT